MFVVTIITNTCQQTTGSNKQTNKQGQTNNKLDQTNKQTKFQLNSIINNFFSSVTFDRSTFNKMHKRLNGK